MTALVAAVFFASLLGSLHCAGMCGAFVAFAVAGDPRRPGAVSVRRTHLHTAYNFGRLITYTALGALAGALGSAIDLAGSAAGLSRAAAIGSGSLMVLFGVTTLLRLHGMRVPKPPLPSVLERVLLAGHRFAAGRGPLVRAGLTGLLTTLLPCGWLYAFAITAAGTADPALGAAVMAAFWAGTLPVLVAVGVGVQKLAGRFAPRLPAVTAAILIIVGAVTIAQRLAVTPLEATALAAMTRPGDHAAAIERLHDLEGKQLPCCVGPAASPTLP